MNKTVLDALLLSLKSDFTGLSILEFGVPAERSPQGEEIRELAEQVVCAAKARTYAYTTHRSGMSVSVVERTM